MAEVAVAEAGGCKLSAGDGFEQREVIGVGQAQGAHAAVVIEDVVGNGVEELGAGRGVFDDGESVEVGVIERWDSWARR